MLVFAVDNGKVARADNHGYEPLLYQYAAVGRTCKDIRNIRKTDGFQCRFTSPHQRIAFCCSPRGAPIDNGIRHLGGRNFLVQCGNQFVQLSPYCIDGMPDGEPSIHGKDTSVGNYLRFYARLYCQRPPKRHPVLRGRITR